MHFELTGALMDDILFSMEDQEGEFYIDTRNGIVSGSGLNEDPFPQNADNPDRRDPGHLDEGRYIDLPKWDSSDGYRLMERFAAALRNPLIREELSAALNRGRGVFRAFKNVLSRYPEAEKVWFSFKEREMKRKILDWYNALREEWGLEKIGLEPEETGDLILEDFRFFKFRKEDTAAALELHAVCEKENCRDNYCPVRNTEESALPGNPVWSAESSSGEFAGFISAKEERGNYYIVCLEVRAEYRGLGLGEALLLRFLENLDTDDNAVFIDLPSGAEGFSRVLAREKFNPCMTRYRLDLKELKE